MLRRRWLTALVLCVSFAHADDTTPTRSKARKKPVTQVQNVESGETAPQKTSSDIDEEITNKKLRAESGSKSRWSISNILTYYGGTVSQPFGQMRPNITNGTGNTAVTALSDQFSGKFNISKPSSLSLGVGARWITPLNSLTDVPTGYKGDKFDAYDPYLKYQYLFRMWGIQNVSSVAGTWTTQNNLVRLGYVGNVNFQDDMTHEFGKSGFSVGALINADIAGFDKDDPSLLDYQSDYSGGIYPTAEYIINDRLNLRTIIGMWVYEHLRSQPQAMTFLKDDIYESFGLGISVTRDFFLYPNIQFIPEHMEIDRTNVGLTAYVNLF